MPILTAALLIALSPLQTATPTKTTPSPSPSPSPEIVKKTEPVQPLRLRVSAGVAEHNLIYRVSPSYPREALRNHIQGEVVLKATIGTDGQVTDLVAESGPPELVEAAKDAVAHWRYKPYLFNGKPVIVDSKIRILFRL